MLTLDQKVDPGHTALLLVDVQNDFLHEKGFMARHSKNWQPNYEMPHRLERLLAAAREFGVMPVFIRNTFSDHTMSPVQQERRERMWPGIKEYICQDGGWGAEFYRIAPQPREAIVTKHRYSAFVNTDIELVLKAHQIKTVLIAGVATNACVEATARHAWMLDYYVVVAGDCCASQSTEGHEGALRGVPSYGTLSSSEELMAIWGRRKAV